MRQALEYSLTITGGESIETCLVLREWAIIYEQDGDQEAALECISKAEEIESNWFKFLINLIKSLAI